jgi:cytochrome c biogenesis protein ResB
MNAIFRFFRSVRLAVTLILVITVLSILATLVPQNRDEAFYRQTFAPTVSQIILGARFDRFFGSVIFLIPLALFTVNLGVCAFDRLLKRHRANAPKRYGPDLIHLGLLLLIAGGIITTALRQEQLFWLGEGEEVEVSGGYSLKLLSFQFLKYENGSPKDWISTVSVARGGKVETAAFPIEVNRPLRLGRLRLYQSSYSTEGTVELKNATGAVLALKIGETFDANDATYYLADVELPPSGGSSGSSATAVFQKWIGHALDSTMKIPVPGSVGPYEVTQITAHRITGLTAVKDPGVLPVIAALVIIGAGLALTYFQKLREVKS